MTFALLGYPVVVALFLWYIRDLTAKQRIREDRLLNRLQAPQVEISRSLSELDPDPEPAFVPFDDDDAYHKYKERL